ncbi:phosphotransferase [Streptomyces sp. NPDC056352]|uniref:phosphotransferase n=1 Tax=Streptomyces sp. NPDC056352 TaxID=3345791 RepID=UPI0035DEA270
MTDVTPELLPHPRVLAAFGLTGRPVLLAGGQGQSVFAGGAVLKPAGSAEGVEWAAELFAGVQGDERFRVPRPLRSAAGGYVVDGWMASEFVAGESGPAGRWDELLVAGRAFHRALRTVSRPEVLDREQHRWAVADRVAWGETTVAVPPDVREPLRGLCALLQPVEAPSQLIHGDLTGNVLFAPRLAPAVIDFSPYWRPVSYADAIVAADGLLYYDEDRELVESAVPGADGLQMLVRALIFRLVALAVPPGPEGVVPVDEMRRFTRVGDRVGRWIVG